MGKPAARISDEMFCTQVDVDNSGSPLPPHVPSALKSSGKVTNVRINGKLAAVVGDISDCSNFNPAINETSFIQSGSSSVKIQGTAAARKDDPTNHLLGKVKTGSPNVNIG